MDKIASRRSELEELRHQAGVINDESLASTRRMLGMVKESEDAGRQTIEALDIQGEQLKRIEQGMDHINADMTKAEGSLSKLKQCCFVCPNPWKKVPTFDESDMDHKYKAEKSNKIIVEQPQVIMPLNSGLTEMSSNGYLKRITDDAREDEMETNLSQVNSILDNIRNIAVDMSSELRNQNEQIGRINTKGNVNAIRLEQANISATDLLDT